VFGAVADFDAAVRDPKSGSQLASAYNSGYYLRLNPEEYRVMAEGMDLRIFERLKAGCRGM
jgi:hypothetical protein